MYLFINLYLKLKQYSKVGLKEKAQNEGSRGRNGSDGVWVVRTKVIGISYCD